MAKIEAPYYPIVHVRGYAATMDEIEETVATPYMGFNLGSTKIRQSYGDRIHRFIFESPLLRLIEGEGYRECFENGGFLTDEASVPARSVLIFRYYERTSTDLGDDERATIPQFAADLRVFVGR